MKLKIIYKKIAIKFIQKNNLKKDEIDELIIKAIKKIIKKEDINIDVKKLVSKDLFRIRKGDIRVIFSYFEDEIIISIVENIGYRGDIYKK